MLLLAGALVLAGGAALLARVLLATPPAPVVVHAPKAPPVEVKIEKAVLVAARDLKPGEFIDNSAVQWQVTEEDLSPLLYFLRGQDEKEVLFGATVRQPVAQGQALANNQVVRPGEPGFVAAVLKPGMRAIAVPTSAVASNSGLVSAGDRVDVILSLNRDKEDSSAIPGAAPRLASQTLLRDVRVLALNNVARSALSLRASAKDLEARKKDRRDTEFYETATLEVPPQEAERLAVAREIGTLQLVLRGTAEPSNGRPVAVNQQALTLSQATSIYRSFSETARPVQAYRGAQFEAIDVSR